MNDLDDDLLGPQIVAVPPPARHPVASIPYPAADDVRLIAAHPVLAMEVYDQIRQDSFWKEHRAWDAVTVESLQDRDKFKGLRALVAMELRAMGIKG